MGKITTDFKKGETMIVMRHDEFTVETFSGNYQVNATNGEPEFHYGTGKVLNGYSSIEEMIPESQCFHNVDEILQKTGIAQLMKDHHELVGTPAEA